MTTRLWLVVWGIAFAAGLLGCRAPKVEVPWDAEALAAADIASPRIDALRRRLLAAAPDAREAALREAWTAIERDGTPFIEPAAQPDLSLVTFLYRGGGEVGNVYLLGSVAPEAPFARLPGTDLWLLSVHVPNDARFTYRLAPSSDPDPHAERGQRFPNAHWDELNHTPYPAGEPLLSLVEMPAAPPQPWLAERPGAPAGKVEETTILSPILGGERPVWIYTPAGFDPHGAPLPLLLVLDGSAYSKLIALPRLLDNLIAAHAIRPVAAVLVGRLEAATRESDLQCNPAFGRFLAEELLPWARARLPLAPEPGERVITGSSLGGLAAVCAALDRPDLFGNVLAQSGAFWWAPDGEPWEAVKRRIAGQERLPIRFHFDAGTFETVRPRDGKAPSILDANRALRDVVTSKGYQAGYTEFVGGHSHANWQAVLPAGLIELLGKPKM